MRLAVLALSVVVAGVGVFWILRWRRSQYRAGLVGIGREVRALYKSRLSRDQPPIPGFGEPGFPPPLVREPIDEATATLLFPSIGHGYVYDPALYYRRPSHFAMPNAFAEYPGGRFVMHTNSLGMREDDEPLATKPDWRVIVTGASNVEGVCPNELSATNLLEALLRERDPGRTMEALNTGTGSYSLYNDLAVLEHYRDLRPDVFVLIVYGGNDFFGCVRLQRYFHRRDLPKEGPHFNTGLEDTDEFARHLGGTELSQVTYFLNNPADVDIALAMACSCTDAMERICRDGSIRFVCAYLPPPLRGQPEVFAGARATVRQRMKLTDEDLAISDRLADRWLAFLGERKIAHVDLRPAFRASRESLYWHADTHVNLAGQRAIAEALLPLVQ